MELPLIPFIWTFRFRREGERLCPWKPLGTRLRTCLPAQENSAMPQVRWLFQRNRLNGLTPTPPTEADNRSLVLFDSGDEVTVQAGDDGIRFLLVSGKPLQEPVAWYGPIVMNTQEQLRQAFAELEQGKFLK